MRVGACACATDVRACGLAGGGAGVLGHYMYHGATASHQWHTRDAAGASSQKSCAQYWLATVHTRTRQTQGLIRSTRDTHITAKPLQPLPPLSNVRVYTCTTATAVQRRRCGDGAASNPPMAHHATGAQQHQACRAPLHPKRCATHGASWYMACTSCAVQQQRGAPTRVGRPRTCAPDRQPARTGTHLKRTHTHTHTHTHTRARAPTLHTPPLKPPQLLLASPLQRREPAPPACTWRRRPPTPAVGSAPLTRDV